jgi:hypothetical protein
VNLIRRFLEIWTTAPGGVGQYPAWLAVLYHLANLAITICYLAIPGIVLYYWRYRRDGIDPLDVVAAMVTVNSVAWLRPKIIHLLRLPSRQQLHDLNDELYTKVNEVHVLHAEERGRNIRLLAEIERLKRMPPDPSERSWLAAKHSALDRIAQVIKGEG